MPIYEFYSPDTNRIYSFFARSLAWHGKVPRCPDGARCRMKKLVSPFAVTGRAREETGDDFLAGMDEQKMEALMAEAGDEMPDLEHEHADPRQLGRFMRKMTALLGDKAPPQLREMISRLEAGEDPEKVEAQLEALETAGNADPFLMQTVRKLRQAAGRPSRDPTLYEFADYCDD